MCESTLEQWSKGIICPIDKKENGKKIKNYGEKNLLNTSSKWYAMVLKIQGTEGNNR